MYDPKRGYQSHKKDVDNAILDFFTSLEFSNEHLK